MNARSCPCDTVSLFDLKLTRAFVGRYADLFPPYLIGLSWISLHCCAVKLVLFVVSSCYPHTTLGKHSHSANKFCRAASRGRELWFFLFFPPSSTSRSCDLHFTYESSRRACGPCGYVQTIVSSEQSTYRGEGGVSQGLVGQARVRQCSGGLRKSLILLHTFCC